MGEEESLLEGIGWKRRSGFGKYANTSWERRRFALTPSKLSYYTATDDDDDDGRPPSKSAVPRGILAILPERATITATYPGDSSQPTPYAVDIKTTDGISKSEITKWKLCFDDRETQLIWLVALTDIVADASVKEYNANVLAAEQYKHEHGGFHRLYQEGDGRLLDLVHNSLLSSGSSGNAAKVKRMSSLTTNKSTRSSQRGGIEVVQHSTRVDIMDEDCSATCTTSSTATSPVSGPNTPKFNHDGHDGGEGNQLTIEKLYQALSVVVVSILYERYAEKSSSFLWQLVNVVILYICFGDTIKSKSTDEKDGGQGGEGEDVKSSLAKKVKIANGKSLDDDGKLVTSVSTMTKSQVGTELMKAEGVPLSCMPSERFASNKKKSNNSTQLLEGWPTDAPADDGRLHRPLTNDEMSAHKHERWAMSAPNVDISGEWTLIADDTFKAEYDAYLKQLGFNGITRKVACSLIARTTEETKQIDNGRELYLKGTNPKGAWERTLTASGYPDFETEPEHVEGEDYNHHKTSIKTADSEDVDAEAWWEEKGTKHRSWLRGGKKYGGGDFESIRYIEEGSEGNVLVCESIFHPKDSKPKAVVKWRFQRD